MFEGRYSRQKKTKKPTPNGMNLIHQKTAAIKFDNRKLLFKKNLVISSM